MIPPKPPKPPKFTSGFCVLNKPSSLLDSSSCKLLPRLSSKFNSLGRASFLSNK